MGDFGRSPREPRNPVEPELVQQMMAERLRGVFGDLTRPAGGDRVGRRSPRVSVRWAWMMVR